jgi:hypothetical protein
MQELVEDIFGHKQVSPVTTRPRRKSRQNSHSGPVTVCGRILVSMTSAIASYSMIPSSASRSARLTRGRPISKKGRPTGGRETRLGLPESTPLFSSSRPPPTASRAGSGCHDNRSVRYSYPRGSSVQGFHEGKRLGGYGLKSCT